MKAVLALFTLALVASLAIGGLLKDYHHHGLSLDSHYGHGDHYSLGHHSLGHHHEVLYPVVKHISVVKKIPIIKHVPVIKHVAVVKHIPVVKEVKIVKKIPIVKHVSLDLGYHHHDDHGLHGLYSGLSHHHYK